MGDCSPCMRRWHFTGKKQTKLPFEGRVGQAEATNDVAIWFWPRD